MNQDEIFLVYTAIFGDYDELIDPPMPYANCKFVCFTDQEGLQSDIWDIRLVDVGEMASHKASRIYKIMPHLFLPDYRYSLYIDANIKILRNPRYLIRHLNDLPMVFFRHFQRQCVYEEAKLCVRFGKGNEHEIRAQIERYKSEGMPINFGLSENSVLLRQHMCEDIIVIMTEWWREFQAGSSRDQLSLPYVLWISGRRYKFISDQIRGGSLFWIRPHRQELEMHEHWKFARVIRRIYKELVYNHPRVAERLGRFIFR